jgi:hypothetical protein
MLITSYYDRTSYLCSEYIRVVYCKGSRKAAALKAAANHNSSRQQPIPLHPIRRRLHQEIDCRHLLLSPAMLGVSNGQLKDSGQQRQMRIQFYRVDIRSRSQPFQGNLLHKFASLFPSSRALS